MKNRGHNVYKINICGGDVFHWPMPNTIHWRGSRETWPQWIAERMNKLGVTDLVIYGDWRPMHRDAVLLANQREIRVWVFEEGYLRPNYITLEEGGVNAASPLPRNPKKIRELAANLACVKTETPSRKEIPFWLRAAMHAWHHVGNLLLWPLFLRYRTHRPYSASRELLGWVRRFIMHKRRHADSLKVLRHFYKQNEPFYFMPLQLDTDSQIRRHSPFSGILESLAVVVTNFCANAPKDSFLLIKNHPLDNGLINYRRYVRSLGAARSCSERLRFLEDASTESLINRCKGVVLCNSTVGLSALKAGKAVYCLGDAVYAIPGLAVSKHEMPLSRFWTELPAPDAALLEDFIHVLKVTALIPGNFFSLSGIEDTVAATLRRMGI
ncbi:MAG: capsular biosynthesis protein [Syntrophorhabdaceae bacterium]|nr:capsular biosynthesis protein [Syntrophorhabdaceae bacterium]